MDEKGKEMEKNTFPSGTLNNITHNTEKITLMLLKRFECLQDGQNSKARAIFYDSTISTRRRRKSMNIEQDEEVEEHFRCCEGISILPDKKCMFFLKIYMNSTQYTISEPRRNNNNSKSKGKSLFYGLHVPFFSLSFSFSAQTHHP